MNIQRLLLKTFAKLPAGVLRRMGGPPIEGRGVPLDPLMQLIWISGKKQPAVESMTPADARAALEDAAATLQNAVPSGVTVSEETVPGPSGDIAVRVYTPGSKGEALPVTLFFHFGGNVIGSPNICHGFCGLLAERANTIVLSVEYRLAPEHPFPAAVEDALAAYTWTLEHAGDLNGDPVRVAVAGDSAGGMLAAVIAQEAKRQGWTPPRCQLLIYPWLTPRADLPSYDDFADAYPLGADTMAWFAGHYFTSDADKARPWADPLNQPDLAGLPEALIVTAGFDPLRDEGEAYAQRLQAAGVPTTYRCYDHLTHAFTMLAGVLPAAQNSLDEIADDLGKRLHKN